MNFDDLKQEFLGVASDALKEVTDEQTKSVQERLNQMINYAIGRFDWYENERHKFLGIALIALPLVAAQAAFSLDLYSSHALSSVFGVLSALVGLVIAMAGVCKPLPAFISTILCQLRSGLYIRTSRKARMARKNFARAHISV